MKRRLILITASLIINGCLANKAQTSVLVNTIEFGSAGGFAGSVTKYSLESNGQLSKKQNGATVPIKLISKKAVKDIFKRARKLESYKFNAPDDIYSFITLKTEKSENSIAWGLASTKVNDNVVKLYNELMALTR